MCRMKPIFVFLFICSLVGTLNGQGKAADTLKLNNGQVLIGTFMGWRKNTVSFNITDAGQVNIYWSNISVLTANANNYRIETTIRKVLYGPITASKPGVFTFMEKGQPIDIPFADIEIITLYQEGGLSHGFFSIGYNYAKSNNFGIVALDGGLNFSSKKWLITGVASSNVVHSKAQQLQRNRENILMTGFRTLNGNWQIGAKLMYQRNLALGLAQRFLFGGGMIYNAILKPHCQLYIGMGLVGSQEGTIDKQYYGRTEVPFVVNLDLYNLGKTGLSLNHVQNLYVGTGNSNRIRHDGELRLNMRLINKFSLTTYLYDNYDSAPVLKTAGNLDYGWNTGLRYGF